MHVLPCCRLGSAGRNRPVRPIPDDGRAGVLCVRMSVVLLPAEGLESARNESALGRQLALGDFSTVSGDPAVAGRACGVCRQPGCAKHQLHGRSWRLRPALSQQFPQRDPRVHADLSEQSCRGARGGHGRAGAADRRRQAALRQLPALRGAGSRRNHREGSESGRSSMSTAGSTVLPRTPRNSARARPMRRFQSWKSSHADGKNSADHFPARGRPKIGLIPTNYAAEAACFPGKSEKNCPIAEPKSRVASAPQLRTRVSIRI